MLVSIYQRSTRDVIDVDFIFRITHAHVQKKKKKDVAFFIDRVKVTMMTLWTGDRDVIRKGYSRSMMIGLECLIVD